MWVRSPGAPGSHGRAWIIRSDEKGVNRRLAVVAVVRTSSHLSRPAHAGLRKLAGSRMPPSCKAAPAEGLLPSGATAKKWGREALRRYRWEGGLKKDPCDSPDSAQACDGGRRPRLPYSLASLKSRRPLARAMESGQAHDNSSSRSSRLRLLMRLLSSRMMASARSRLVC